MSADLLPPNATSQERSITLSATSVRQPGGQVIATLWNPQTCPADLLPWLAFALSVEGWTVTWTEKQKRDAIAASVEVHRIKGTVGAVKRALQAIGYEVYIDENTGQPYTFRLQVDLGTQGLPESTVLDQAERIALATKNARSHLLGVSSFGNVGRILRLLVAQIDGQDTAIWPEMVSLITSSSLMRVLSAEQTVDTVSISPNPDDTVVTPGLLEFVGSLEGGGGYAYVSQTNL